MTRWEGIEDYDTRMLCGEPTLNPRLKDIPVRIPQPQPDVPISIYEIQKGLKKRAFKEQPFFITLGIHKPHVPFLAPDKYFDLYPIEKIQFTPDRPNLWDTLPSTAISKRYRSFGFELGKENPSLRREYMQAYHACISSSLSVCWHFVDCSHGLCAVGYGSVYLARA